MATTKTAVATNATPWMTKPSEKGCISLKNSKTVEWYQPTLKQLPASTVNFFVDYVGLQDEEDVKRHIYQVRDRSWNVLPYPCIGLFRFLDFSIHLSPMYEDVVCRVKSGQTLLDMGCCLGQDLRRLAHDAGTSKSLIGVDLEQQFLQLGYELFRDSDTFAAHLEAGSVLDEHLLEPWRGKIDMIHLGSFLHLFKFDQQRQIIGNLSRLLSPREGSLIFGRSLAADQGGEFHMKSVGWDLYRHDHGTIQELFESSVTGKKAWRVTNFFRPFASANWDDNRRGWQGDETKEMMFTASAISDISSD